jgi:hypothetical protein
MPSKYLRATVIPKRSTYRAKPELHFRTSTKCSSPGSGVRFPNQMNRIAETTTTDRSFCLEGEGMLAAVQIMADHHLRQVLVINSAGEIVGKYMLNSGGITLSRTADANRAGSLVR